MTFVYKTKIHLCATDATGVLYFAEQFRLALDALQEFLNAQGLSLRTLFDGDFLVPVVHAEGDYFAPLMIDDEVEISVEVGKIGTSSFTMHYIFFDPCRKIEVGKVTLVHVSVSKETRAKIPLPASLRAKL